MPLSSGPPAGQEDSTAPALRSAESSDLFQFCAGGAGSAKGAGATVTGSTAVEDDANAVKRLAARYVWMKVVGNNLHSHTMNHWRSW